MVHGMNGHERNRALKLGIYHGTAICVLLFLMFVYKCPFSYFFGVPCPGCGVSRAYLAALHFDFRAAFAYHPLFFTVAPAILYVAHRNVLRKRLKGKTETFAAGVILFCFVAVYIYRLLSGNLACLI